jgi:hypothetical protein
MSALLDAPDMSGNHLIEYYRSHCPLCKGAVRWELLCEEHAPLVRTYFDPEYLPWLRAEIARLESRAGQVEGALELQARIDTGLEKMLAGTVDATKGAAQIAKLEAAKAEDDRSLDTELLLIRLHDYDTNLVYWQQQLSYATQKPPQ